MDYRDANYYIDKLDKLKYEYFQLKDIYKKRYKLNIIYSIIYGVLNMDNVQYKDIVIRYICADKFLYGIYMDLQKNQYKQANEKIDVITALNDVIKSLDKIQKIISQF